ncbi:hypothetical protein F5887DRAFT_928430 [Amanita rubescens]|nr:hypothetical protein F5887DRAFT_928430 [Amanita rubescens]
MRCAFLGAKEGFRDSMAGDSMAGDSMAGCPLKIECAARSYACKRFQNYLTYMATLPAAPADSDGSTILYRISRPKAVLCLTSTSRRTYLSHVPNAAPITDELKTQTEDCWKQGMSDIDTVKHLKRFYDTSLYSLGVKKYQQWRKGWGLHSGRTRQWSDEELMAKLVQIKPVYPGIGARRLVDLFRIRDRVVVPEVRIAAFLRQIEPEEVRRRKGKKFKRKRFYAAGVMAVLAMDQHDKWGQYGYVAWLKIWRTNHNPRLIAKYYLDTVRYLGGVPLITQSDRGTENNSVANIQTLIRQRLEPRLEGTLQHRWVMASTHNVKPEAFWSYLHHHFTPGFENVLQATSSGPVKQRNGGCVGCNLRGSVFAERVRQHRKVLVRVRSHSRGSET